MERTLVILLSCLGVALSQAPASQQPPMCLMECMSEWLTCEFECRVEFPPVADFVEFAGCAAPCEEERLACMMSSPDPACNNNTLNNIAHLPFQIDLTPTTTLPPLTTTTTAAPTTTTTSTTTTTAAPKTTTTAPPPPPAQPKPVNPQPRVQTQTSGVVSGNRPMAQPNPARPSQPRVQAPSGPVISGNRPMAQPNPARPSQPRVQAPSGPVVSLNPNKAPLTQPKPARPLQPRAHVVSGSARPPTTQQRAQSPYNSVVSRGPRPVISAGAPPQQNIVPRPSVSEPQPQQLQQQIVPPRNVFSGRPKLSYPKPRPTNLQQPRPTNLQQPRPTNLQQPRPTNLQQPRLTNRQQPRPTNHQQRQQNIAQQNLQRRPVPASNKLSAIGTQPTNAAPAPTVQKSPSNSIYNRLKSKHVQIHKLSYSFKNNQG